MYIYKKLFQLFVLLFSILFFVKSYAQDTLHGEFTYLVKAKFDLRTVDKREEFFFLQIGDHRAFSANVISLKGDSVMANSGKSTKNPDGSTILGWKKGVKIPKTNFNFTIIQSNENVQFFDYAGMSLLTYKEPLIKNWKLINETKVISTINCKKAEVTFKGRNWIAWYSPEITFPYGPMKFCGLP